MSESDDAPRDAPDPEVPGSLGPVRRRGYQGNVGKHKAEPRGRISREPGDGQGALDFSVPVKPTSPVRVGIDYEERCIVVLRPHGDGPHRGTPNDVLYHGYVVPWSELHQSMKNALCDAGMTSRTGKIL